MVFNSITNLCVQVGQIHPTFDELLLARHTTGRNAIALQQAEFPQL